MILRLLRKKSEPLTDPVAEAGRLFASGYNCAQAVLQATTGRSDRELLSLAQGFGGGIGGEKCLCGAISGGVMALGLLGHSSRSGALVKAFRSRFKVTCCKGLSAPYRWKSPEHLANCRHLTESCAALVVELTE